MSIIVLALLCTTSIFAQKDEFEFGWYPPARRVVFTRNVDSNINGLYFKMSDDDLRYGQELALGYLKDIKLIEKK